MKRMPEQDLTLAAGVASGMSSRACGGGVSMRWETLWWLCRGTALLCFGTALLGCRPAAVEEHLPIAVQVVTVDGQEQIQLWGSLYSK